jgi:hypothetical protein
MPKDILEPDAVDRARTRLDQCARSVDLLRSLLADLPRGTPAHAAALAWTKELERSRFCRRLELEDLTRERRGEVLSFRAGLVRFGTPPVRIR